jgi:hypothetical protein
MAHIIDDWMKHLAGWIGLDGYDERNVVGQGAASSRQMSAAFVSIACALLAAWMTTSAPSSTIASLSVVASTPVVGGSPHSAPASRPASTET